MSTPTDLVTRLLEGDVGERREAASDLVERATSNPGVFAPAVDRVVGALDDPDDRVRTAAARICFEVGTYEPDIVEPVLEDLSNALDDPVAGVRANVARPVAAVIAEDPEAGWVAAPTLRDRLDDPSESVRHSVVWGLEWLATRHSEVVSPGQLTDLLDDEHPPVRKHAARTCALLPDRSERRRERLLALLSDDAIPVRRAACLALGATGASADRDALAQVARADLNDGVRTASRRPRRAAVREAAYAATVLPGGPTGGTAVRAEAADGDGETLASTLVAGDRAVGRWLRVDAPDVMVRGGRFRGRVEAVDPLEGTLDVRNRAVGYRLSLRRTRDGWTGTYDGEERSGRLDVQPTAAARLDTERTPLRYAVEGDRLGFEIEGTPHAIEVTDRDVGSGRLRGENRMQGYAVEFRPDTPGPLRALFERGRTFEASDVSLLVEGHEGAETERAG
jgi:hypothetical protein